MKITREQLIKIIKEEYAATITTEGLQDEGLRENIEDFLVQELSGWHDVAKAQLHKHVAENGFDISEIIFKGLGGGMQEELDASLPSGGDSVKQEYDALTTMITRLDGMEDFLLKRERSFFDTHPEELHDMVTKLNDVRHIMQVLKKELK